MFLTGIKSYVQVQHDPLPVGFAEIDIVKGVGEKLGMVIKGGIKVSCRM